VADEPARQAFGEAVEEIASAGVRLVDRRTSPLVEAVEASIAEAVDISWDILGFEFRWPVGPIILRAGDRLSAFQHEQNARGLSVSREKFANLLARRESMRQLFATLVGSVDGAITLAAPGAAPLGQHFTGNPVFNAPASALGLPALSLPLLEAEGMPLGVQLIGFKDRDRELFSHAAWCLAALEHE
jgi:Asp-tRNA(Asn)/Glu-tRNA(Gln) amidotransferase A subunit family amidase